MKFLLDENFPKSAAEVVEECGHIAIAFEDACDFGADDDTVFATAQRLGAVILTSDRDFYHTVPLLHPHHAGIVVVALRQPNRRAVMERLKWFLANAGPSLVDKVCILRDFSYRIKR